MSATKKILVPISFSDSSVNALKKAASLYDNCQITLLHCYPVQAYNRPYDFGSKSYDIGIREMLINFSQKHLNSEGAQVNYMIMSGPVSNTVAKYSDQFDLLVMSKKNDLQSTGYWFGDKVYYIASKGMCPVLLVPDTDKLLDLTKCGNIWHINRQSNETQILQDKLPQLEIDSVTVEHKTLSQSHFKSSFWKAILNYAAQHDDQSLNQISESVKNENVDLVILVSHRKNTFQKFMKAEVVQIFNQYNIPILIFQDDRK